MGTTPSCRARETPFGQVTDRWLHRPAPGGPRADAPEEAGRTGPRQRTPQWDGTRAVADRLAFPVVAQIQRSASAPGDQGPGSPTRLPGEHRHPWGASPRMPRWCRRDDGTRTARVDRCCAAWSIHLRDTGGDDGYIATRCSQGRWARDRSSGPRDGPGTSPGAGHTPGTRSRHPG